MTRDGKAAILSKGQVGEIFGKVAGALDEVEPRVLTLFGRKLVEQAALPPGADVLDVASGKGGVLFAAAEHARRAVAIDLAPEMVAEVQTSIGRRALTNVEAHVMDAEALSFPSASFDAVFCALGLFFFPDHQRALREFARVLRPGGVLGVSIWGTPDPRWGFFGQVASRYTADLRLTSDHFDTPAKIETELRVAGFDDVRHVEEVYDAALRDGPHWLSWAHSFGFRAIFDHLTPEQLERFKAEIFPQLEQVREPDGHIHYVLRANLAYGRKPGL